MRMILKGAHRSELDLFARGDRPKFVGLPPQCVTCSRFVKVDAPGTRPLPEYGDFGVVLSCEFECGRCAERTKSR